LQANGAVGSCVLPDFENMQVMGVATDNGSMCLVQTSYARSRGCSKKCKCHWLCPFFETRLRLLIVETRQRAAENSINIGDLK
jgi:hypothetical protein